MLLDQLLPHLCDSGAKAVEYHAKVTGLSPDAELSEYLLPVSIFRDLADKIPMRLEMNGKKLRQWNMDHRGAACEPFGDRVDAVMFDEKQNFLALVEVKSGYISVRDRNKLLRILTHIDTCPYGVVCGQTNQANHDWAEKTFKSFGDRWRSTRFDVSGVPYYFCAAGFERNAQLAKAMA